MFFDGLKFKQLLLVYCALLPLALRHSWLRSFEGAMDGVEADHTSRDTRIMTPRHVAEWLAYRPSTLLALLCKYTLGLAFVVWLLVWLCLASCFKIALWTIGAVFAFAFVALAATRLHTHEDAHG